MKHINKFNFKSLFIFDLANNHQGDVTHGARVINDCADVVNKYDIRAVIKFQFRDLPDFVHRDEQISSTNKHVPRFLSTHLPWEDFKKLLVIARERNMLAMCTPFDELSVDMIVDFGFDLIKVASCSARDWPLLEKIASSGLPIIASTGGLTQKEVDDLVSFLIHKGCDFALMHCVSIYPTPDEACQLGNIAGFKERYPGRVVGWSTHEPPQDTVQIAIALALGAEMFERHIGVETDKFKLNAYSSNPIQVDNWLRAYVHAMNLIGSHSRGKPLEIERQSIDDLRRGVFAKKSLEVGKVLTLEDIYFAFPLRPGQLSSGEWKPGIILNEPLMRDQPLKTKDLTIPVDELEQILKSSIHEVKALLSYARVPLSHEFSTEYSHHYGILNFREVGVVLITVINREYAKKILVQLAGQRHPMHFHKLKEETFIVLWGELISDLDGRERVLKPGDSLTIPPGVWHSFRTEVGCVFEEISTTAYSNDSVYRDPEINALSSAQRKTNVDHWGRFQIAEQLRGKK